MEYTSENEISKTPGTCSRLPLAINYHAGYIRVPLQAYVSITLSSVAYVQNFKETTREHTVWDGFFQTVNTQDMCMYSPTVRMTKMDQCVKRQTVFYQNFESSTRGTA